MSTSDKTVVDGCIHLFEPGNPGKGIIVHRLSRRKMGRCSHEWLPISWLFQAHGKSGRGCKHCGKLGRT